MSRRIFRDLEEAIAREVRRITTHDSRTVDHLVLEETFDPITGEIIKIPVEANFYDSSANTNNIIYPHFFIRLMKSREDRFSGRAVPQYGRWCRTPSQTSPQAFEIVFGSSDGAIAAPGNEMTTSQYQIRKAQVGYLLRILSGNNIGTYIVDSITPSAIGPHSILVSSTLVEDLPEGSFNATTREFTFLDKLDLNTIEIGDIFEDSLAATFNITAIDIATRKITLDGVTSPDTNSGSKITRSGDIFKNSDPSLVRYIIMDPSKPIIRIGVSGEDEELSSSFSGISPAIPLDVYYLVRIDSKEQKAHIDILNRVWEEFNPPRTALPVIRRTSLSAEQALAADIPSGGSSTVTVEDNSDFNINDTVFVFDELTPTKGSDGDFPSPFESKIVNKIDTDQLVLADVVPDTFIVENGARIVSNAEFERFMLHFVDHVTKDVEDAQYWVHEFTFWTQVWVDRLEEAEDLTAITEVSTPIEDDEDNIIIEDL